MVYFLLVALVSLLTGIALFLLKRPFFKMANATTSLLDTILDNVLDEDEKHEVLISKVGPVLKRLFMFIFLLSVYFAMALLPLYLFARANALELNHLDTSSWIFFLSLIIGFLPLMLAGRIFKTKKTSDYSDWSQLLHHIILDNYNLSGSLFTIEKKLFGSKLKKGDRKFLIVSGLARAGTTALTTKLHGTDRFHSLKYSNMPMLLGVNLWKKLHRPKKEILKERHHGDQVQFGLESVEALEEYFFKVMLRDSYIHEERLVEHQVPEEVVQKYLQYQDLIAEKGSDTIYLAKNNNFILRYESMRKSNPGLYIIFMFRDPIAHAYSLLEQHQKLGDLQRSDPFALDYMTWLGHHEFGLDHRPFSWTDQEFDSIFPADKLDYWLSVWINYYSHVLRVIGHDQTLLIDYKDFLHEPDKVIQLIGDKLSLDRMSVDLEPFIPKNKVYTSIDPELKKKSEIIYLDLVKLKTSFNQ